MENLELAKKTIIESNKILICLPHHSSFDEIFSALALAHTISKIKPLSPDIICEKLLKTKDEPKFEELKNIKNILPPLKNLIIRADLKNTQLKEFTYDIKEGNVLEIQLEPKSGSFDDVEVTHSTSEYKYDLIITLSVTDLGTLGNVFKYAPDFFYNTTKINIDYHIQNTNYGQINIIKPFNISVSEIVYDLINILSEEFVKDKKVATYLLLGIMNKSHGMQNPNLNPPTLQKISNLLQTGVDIAEINKILYHNKSINTLKLWGRILARLKEHENLKLIYSVVSYDDFLKTNTDPSDIPEIIDEFMTTHSNSNLMMVIWQYKEENVQGIIKSNTHQNTLQLLAEFSPEGGSSYTKFTLNTKNLLEAESVIIKTLEEKIK